MTIQTNKPSNKINSARIAPLRPARPSGALCLALLLSLSPSLSLTTQTVRSGSMFAATHSQTGHVSSRLRWAMDLESIAKTWAFLFTSHSANHSPAPARGHKERQKCFSRTFQLHISKQTTTITTLNGAPET